MNEIEKMIIEIRDPSLNALASLLYNRYREALQRNPASTKYHHNYAGGLEDHIAKVMQFAKEMYEYLVGKGYKLKFTLDDALFIAFVHDLGKIGLYRQTLSGFAWNPGQLPHEQKSKLMVQEMDFDIPDKYENAIMLHHGGWAKVRPPTNLTQLAYFIHICDLLGSQFEEVK